VSDFRWCAAAVDRSHFDVYDIVPKLASKYIDFIKEFASSAA
jgi:hypothetical protein